MDQYDIEFPFSGEKDFVYTIAAEEHCGMTECLRKLGIKVLWTIYLLRLS